MYYYIIEFIINKRSFYLCNLKVSFHINTDYYGMIRIKYKQYGCDIKCKKAVYMFAKHIYIKS